MVLIKLISDIFELAIVVLQTFRLCGDWTCLHTPQRLERYILFIE